MLDLEPGTGNFYIFILLGFLLPFIINISLSKTRGKNVILTLFLTQIFSWIVTLSQTILSKEENE
jgi:hypothetical protein